MYISLNFSQKMKKTHSEYCLEYISFHFYGKVTARQFCFEINLPLPNESDFAPILEISVRVKNSLRISPLQQFESGESGSKNIPLRIIKTRLVSRKFYLIYLGALLSSLQLNGLEKLLLILMACLETACCQKAFTYWQNCCFVFWLFPNDKTN